MPSTKKAAKPEEAMQAKSGAGTGGTGARSGTPKKATETRAKGSNRSK